ncbi:Prolyl 4-hydroxylase 5 [Madurella mycetomatis]|uniref:Prolyl 4-hydroxylase 5 n=1 Tax=Madurella mycetomatis TaxID=100816 RepID=A0A175W4C9_9PEZI|nr:Prolyl 4-hydroxylase 5 [Madurella mycetomatis]
MAGPLQLLVISTTVALSAYFGPPLLGLLIPTLQTHLPFPIFSTPPPPSELACPPHAYTTQLVSLDPLLVLIHNFTPPAERAAIIAAGTPLLVPSPINAAAGNTDAANTQFRTSHSAPLPGGDAAVACALSRARAFLGTLLAPARDEMGPAQMVRYTPGQKFDLHHDWFKRPRIKLTTDCPPAAGRACTTAFATFLAVLGVDEHSRRAPAEHLVSPPM